MAQPAKTEFWRDDWRKPINPAYGGHSCDQKTLDRVKFPVFEFSDCIAFTDSDGAARFINDLEQQLKADGLVRARDKEPPKPGESDLRMYARPNAVDCWKLFLVAPEPGGRVWMGYVVKHCGGGRIQ